MNGPFNSQAPQVNSATQATQAKQALNWTQMDVGELLRAMAGAKWAGQLKGLDPQKPQEWPALPRYLLLVAVGLGVLALLWWVGLSTTYGAYQAEVLKETQLRAEFQSKQNQAVNLDSLKLQREQVFQYVTQLEQQLPSTSDMGMLLADINQAGQSRSLQFELLRPGQVALRDYHAELPIELKVIGRFHNMGLFASDVAQFSRIVTLNNLSISTAKDPQAKDTQGKDVTIKDQALAAGADKGVLLTMEATAKTFRYLDAQELKAQSLSKAGKK
jgi:type IV pilus assembly protein PilO